MNVLVATRRTQGFRPGDFAWTVDGELVMFPTFYCDGGDDDDPASLCGCQRSFSGLTSRRATTTAEVVDLGLTAEGLAEEIARALADGQNAPVTEFAAEAREAAADVVRVAAAYPVGAVLGHDRGETSRRA